MARFGHCWSDCERTFRRSELSFDALMSAAGERSPPGCPAGMDGPLAVQAEIAGSISRREECESSILLVSGK
jgi:hypothetical protein